MKYKARNHWLVGRRAAVQQPPDVRELRSLAEAKDYAATTDPQVFCYP